MRSQVSKHHSKMLHSHYVSLVLGIDGYVLVLADPTLNDTNQTQILYAERKKSTITKLSFARLVFIRRDVIRCLKMHQATISLRHGEVTFCQFYCGRYDFHASDSLSNEIENTITLQMCPPHRERVEFHSLSELIRPTWICGCVATRLRERNQLIMFITVVPHWQRCWNEEARKRRKKNMSEEYIRRAHNSTQVKCRTNELFFF